MMSDDRKYPYMPWWLYDYNSDSRVQAMTDDQDLAYRRMIEVSWDLGRLPNSAEKISSLIRFSRRKFTSVWKYPLIDCWEEKDGELVNARVEKEKQKVRNRYQQLKKASNAGVLARKNQPDDDHTETTRQPDGNHMVTKWRGYSDLDSNKDPNTKILSKENKISKKEGSSGSQGSGTPPAVRGRVKWNKEEQKLDATDPFKQEFLACWKKHFEVEEIKEEMIKATRWLVPRPGRRGNRSRLDLYLHKWMEGALVDKIAKEEEEASTSRPPPPEPEEKYCPKCRETKPDHALWCPTLKGGGADGVVDQEGGRDHGGGGKG